MIDRRFSGRVCRPIGSFEHLIVNEDKKTKERSYSLVVTYPVRDGNDKSVAELDVDTFAGQEFMLNSNGFITNDIMMFEQCQSDSVARSVLNRLKVLHPQAIDQNLTLDQMMASCVPANYGSPSEFVSANKAIAEKMYKLYDADCKAYAAQQAELASQRAAAEAANLSKQNDLEGSIPKSE